MSRRSARLFHVWCLGCARSGLGGQVLAREAGGAFATWCRACQALAQGQSQGRCRSRRLAVEAMRPGMLMIFVRRLAHRALARSAATAVARAMLNAMTAQAVHAALAAYFPCLILSPCLWQAPDLHVCVVDTVIDVASAELLSAWADEFRGLSVGRVAA